MYKCINNNVKNDKNVSLNGVNNEIKVDLKNHSKEKNRTDLNQPKVEHGFIYRDNVLCL